MLRRLQEAAAAPKGSDSTSLTLASATSGRFRCVAVDADGVDARRIKRMGLCEGLFVEVLGTGDPMIILVSHSKLGLSRYLARKIEVVPADEVGVPVSTKEVTSRRATGEIG